MQIRLNGAPYDIPEGMTVSQLILKLELDPKGVAVERNLEIVPRSVHSDTYFAEGDAVEIVEFVGGG